MNKPPPVKKNSLNKDLWNELICAREEIEKQQRIINDQAMKINADRGAIFALRYQLQIIRSVVAGEVP